MLVSSLVKYQCEENNLIEEFLTALAAADGLEEVEAVADTGERGRDRAGTVGR